MKEIVFTLTFDESAQLFEVFSATETSEEFRKYGTNVLTTIRGVRKVVPERYRFLVFVEQRVRGAREIGEEIIAFLSEDVLLAGTLPDGTATSPAILAVRGENRAVY